MDSVKVKPQPQPQTHRKFRRARSLVARHPALTAAVVVSAVAVAIFGFLWFRPDKLFVNTTVNEALPSAPAPPPAVGGTTAPTAPAPRILSSGSFRSLEHETDGLARLVRLADGRQIVRLEDFQTSNGPDVLVTLSDAPATSGDAGAYDDGEFVSIGGLKANHGNQNYEIPRDVDPSKYQSVVIWCRRFNVAFGAAPLDLKG